MTAFHNIILLSVGAPLTPAGGSSCNLQHIFNVKIGYNQQNMTCTVCCNGNVCCRPCINAIA